MNAATKLSGAVVELYNLPVPGRSPFWYTNGYYVFQYTDGCRGPMLLNAKGDESAARAFAAEFNGS